MTVLLAGVDAAVTALRARLLSTGTLPAYVAAVNAANGDSLLAAPPDERVYAYVPPIDMIPDTPAIAIGLLPGRLENDGGSFATGVYGLAVLAFEIDADQATLTAKLRRWHRAIMSCVLEGRTLGGTTGIPWSVQCKTWDFGPALADRPGKNEAPITYMSWVTLAFEVKLEEY